MLHVWYIDLHNWVIYVGQMLGFIFQHHGSHMGPNWPPVAEVCLRRISYYPKSPERLGPAPSLSLSPASARSARTKPQSEAIQFIQVEDPRRQLG